MASLLINSSFNLAATLSAKLLAFVGIMWLGSELDIGGYANFSLLYAVHQGLSGIVGAGIVEAIIGSNKKVSVPEILGVAIRGTLPLSGVALFLFVLFGSGTYVELGDPREMLVACFSGLLLGYAIFYSRLLRLCEKHTQATMTNSGSIAVFFIGGLIAFYFTKNILYFFVVGLICMCLLIARSAFSAIRQSGANRKTSWEVSNLIRNSIPFVMVALLAWISGIGNVFIVEAFLDLQAVASFSFLYIYSGVMLIVANSFNQIWSPRFYVAFYENGSGNLERDSEAFFSLEIIALSVFSVVLLYFALFAESFGLSVFSKYSDSALPLGMLLVSYIIYAPVWHCRNHLYVRGAGRVFMRLSLYASILGLISNLVLIYALGEVGVYLGIVGLACTQAIIFLTYSRRNFEIRLPFKAMAGGLYISILPLILNALSVPSGWAVLLIVLSISILILIMLQDLKRGLKVCLT